MPVHKICEVCGKEFKIKPSAAEKARYCSRKCADTGKSKKVRMICPRCGKEFWVSPSMTERRRYCSMKCRKNQIEKVCEICGKVFYVIESRKDTARFCSKQCYGKSGECGTHPKPSARKPRKMIHCLQCNKEVSVIVTSNQRFCCQSCAAQYRDVGQLKTLPRVTKICETCGKEFEVYPRQAPARRFCSRVCAIRSTTPTDIEQALIDSLGACNIDFEYEYPIGKWVIDIALPEFKLAVEADGIYWHSLPGIAEKDKRKDTYLNEHGWTVLRLPGDEIRKNPENCIGKILACLSLEQLEFSI